MKRAKFETIEEQRKFFINVKKKLGIGSKKISRLLGLKSRGPIENYSLMRTSPPVEIIKKLERLSGIKAPNYEAKIGKVYRKKRGFTPIESEVAIKKLKEKFKKDFGYVTKLVKSDLIITQIIKKIRDRGYSFDNHRVSIWIGSYRKSFLSKIVKDISIREGEIIVSGFIRPENKTLSINFNLSPLYKKLKNKKIRVGMEIANDRKKIRIFPIDFGRVLSRGSGTVKILITTLSELEIRSKVKVILNPEKFGFNIFDSIYDADAKPLARVALEKGFTLDNHRSTPANHKGDLSLYYKEKNIMMEITRANSYKGAYFKVGQCYIQKLCWSKSIQILVCKKKFLPNDAQIALNKLGVKIIYTEFSNNWEEKVIKKLIETLK